MFSIFKKISENRLNRTPGRNILGILGKSATLVLGAIVLISLVPAQVRAATADNGNIVTNFIGGLVSAAVGWPIFIISYIIASIFGLAISIISYFISIILQLNMNIISSNIVGSGFTVTLALANLGFVLSIIIIAIATILRYETYALKQTLWKLVAAAILVNFSLVICGAILNFSNQLSLYFLNSINPGGSGSSYDNFASALAGSFGPQKIFLGGAGDPSFSNAAGGNTGAANLMENSGQRFGSVLVQILNLIFPTLFLIVAVIALAGFFIMLLIRYIYLGILLIIMPMAWLLWIFPATSSQWQKWWSKFIQWTMFAPIVLFFIWLALLTMGGNDPNNIQGIAFQSPSQNPIVASISTFTGNVLSTVLGSLLNMTLMIAMLFAGLFMASSMGITFASTTIKGASAVTTGFGRAVGRRGIQMGGATLDRLKVREGAQKLQQVKLGAGSTSKLVRGAGAVASYGAGWLGRGLESTAVATREDLVKDAQGRLSNMTNDQLANGVRSTFTAPEKVAALDMLRQRGTLDKLGGDLNRYMDESMFTKYRQEHTMYKDLDKAWLSNKAMRDAAEKGGLSEELLEEAGKYVVDLKAADISKGKNWDDVFKEGEYGGLTADQKRNLAVAQIRAMAEKNQALLSPIISQLRGKNLKNFDSLFKQAVAGMEAGKKKDLETKFGSLIYYNMFGHHQPGEQVQTQAPAAQQNQPPAGGGAH